MPAGETPAEFNARMRSVGVISRRTRDRVTEGREHPESGKPFKTTTDDLGNEVTEHGVRGSGLSDRQDVNIMAPSVHLDLSAQSAETGA